MKILDRYWRIVATGFCFLCFGLGGVLLAVVMIPFIILVTPDRLSRRHRIQGLVSTSFRFFVRLMQWLGVMSFTYENVEQLRQDAGVIVVANHPSLIDVVVLGGLMGRLDCIVKEALWRNPVLKGVVKAADFIPNTMGDSLLDACQQRLSQGANLIIFPEGTRSTPGQELQLQRGAAQLAVRAGAPVRLVHIFCAPTTLSKGEKWYDVPLLRPHFRVSIGQLIDVKDFFDGEIEPSIAARRLTRYMKESFEREIA